MVDGVVGALIMSLTALTLVGVMRVAGSTGDPRQSGLTVHERAALNLAGMDVGKGSDRERQLNAWLQNLQGFDR